MSRIACLCLLQSFLLFGSSFADDDFVPDSATKVKYDFAQWCKVGDYTFALEGNTTLADVIKALGGGAIERISAFGDADPEWAVDYTDGSHLIRFSCDSDMGGENHDLLSVEIIAPTGSEKIANLPSLRLPIAFQFGSAKMSFLDITKALGSAVITRGTAWYEYSGKKPIKDSLGKILDYDVLGTLQVKVVGGKIVALTLSRVFSY